MKELFLSQPTKKAAILFSVLSLATLCLAQQAPFRQTLVGDCVSKTIVSSTIIGHCDDEGAQFNNLGESVSLNGAIGSSGLGEQLTADLLAEARFGTLRSRSSASFSITGLPGVAFTFANASFGDIVTVDFPPFRGQQGQLIVQFTLNGSISTSGQAGTFAVVDVNVSNPDGADFQDGNVVFTSSASGVFTIPTIFHFTYGQPFILQFLLQTRTGTETADEFRLVLGNGNGTADFSNTLGLAALEVADANGNPLSGQPTFTSASGTNYSTDGVLRSFERFSASAEVEPHEREFEARGSFLLGSGSSGIDPLSEDVAIQVGTFSAVIPAGSFKLHRNGHFQFNGVINGAELQVTIRAREEGEFTFSAHAQRANLTGTTKPVTVRLIVGDDGGETISREDVDE